MSMDLVDAVAGWFGGEAEVGSFQQGDVGKFLKVMKGGDTGKIVIVAKVFVRDGAEYAILVDTTTQESYTKSGDELKRMFQEGRIIEVNEDGTARVGADAEVGKSKKAKRRAAAAIAARKAAQLQAQQQQQQPYDDSQQYGAPGPGDEQFPDEGSEGVAVGEVEFQTHEGAGWMAPYEDTTAGAFNENAIDRQMSVGTSFSLPVGWEGKWLKKVDGGATYQVTKVYTNNGVPLVTLARPGFPVVVLKVSGIAADITAGKLVWTSAPAAKSAKKFAQAARAMR